MIPEYESKLDDVFTTAFDTNHPAMLDYVQMKMELKRLRAMDYSQSDGELVERLRNEAQIHAQESRCQTSTVHEIYQLITGATGEPGNWNGAEPVRKLIAENQRYRTALEQWKCDRCFGIELGQSNATWGEQRCHVCKGTGLNEIASEALEGK
jgi:hypothetical protein